ncbi:MAG: efflux RND transporter periplasmic adaptor subunit [Gammaproteobacteria bacterium]|nr:efflux RND transporter periplasmic adaptor subunit [Gammaproteobacteria bacterium]
MKRILNPESRQAHQSDPLPDQRPDQRPERRPTRLPTRRSWALSLGLTLAVVLWMLSGTFVGASRSTQPTPAPSAASEPERRMSVLVTESQASRIDREIVVQGELEPERRVTLRAETEGQVIGLPVEKGALVEAGELLVELAEDDRPEQLARAEAEVAARRLELTASEKLGSQGMQARTQIKSTQAALATAEAELARLRVDLDRLQIRAPFGGVVETREVELGSLLQRGDPVLELVDNSRLKAVGHVPQQSASALQLGQAVVVKLLDGSRAEGKLTYVARVADPQTRSFRVEAEIPNPDRALGSGVSAELSIKVGEESGHFVSPAVLTLDDQGRIGVRTVDTDDRVHFHPISLVRTQIDGVWVSGLPMTARIITQGQGFVTEGERVDPVTAPPGSTLQDRT